ncbi:F0F1 ATP synthase subunit epsilon [Gemmata sp. SH-PL17]|uniref:F0F1 ATP synthase subunit epsilon n=1 Tax=Gemmata sp. SH-PL17 TaxID=1630693 RepID=UPI0006960BE5|nr:F0F1 ATP synthase subunit epsilon [Gemmata sp. SH-PL17]
MAGARQPEPNQMSNTASGPLRLIVVTPERAVLDEAAEMVILPMIDGELGVQRGRAPLIGRLGAGELRLNSESGVTRWFIDAGFVQVRSNVVTVLTAKARPASEVTPEMVIAAANEAAALPATNAVERANKAKANDRASGLKRVADKNIGA